MRVMSPPTRPAVSAADRRERFGVQPLRLSFAALSMAGLAMAVGCSDHGGEDLVPSEPETGEEDREIVPGEGGPVD